MTAIEQMQQFYANDPSLGDLTDHIDAHILHGCLYVTPTALAMARPVLSTWSNEDLSNPLKTCLTCAPDCWYVWAAIGDLDYLLSLIPYPLPLIAFARRRIGKPAKRIRFYNFQQIIKHGRIHG